MLSRLVIREGNGNPLQYSCLENPVVGEPGREARVLDIETEVRRLL